MDTLLAFSFPTLDHGSGALSKLEELDEDELLNLKGAVAACRAPDGNIHSVRLKRSGSNEHSDASETDSAFTPFFGAVTGAALGAAARPTGAETLQDGFVKRVSARLQDGKAVLCVQVSELERERALERLRGMGGELFHSNMEAEQDSHWKQVLRGRHPDSSLQSPSHA